MRDTKYFADLQHNLRLFHDENGLLRCKGRMENAPLTFETKFPLLLPRDSQLAELFILEAHERVMHNGVKDTLAELRSQYWIVRGRQLVRNVLAKCSICKRVEGRGYEIPKAPPLPKFRLENDYAFLRIGVDYAGLLFFKNIYGTDHETYKSYILLITCAATRAVHLELVPDMNAESFKRGLTRLQVRRGVPGLIISDNGKTFKDRKIQNYLIKNGINWKFNVPEAPQSGGFFERMVRSTKRCLRKALRNARLNFEELMTIVTEIKGFLIHAL